MKAYLFIASTVFLLIIPHGASAGSGNQEFPWNCGIEVANGLGDDAPMGQWFALHRERDGQNLSHPSLPSGVSVFCDTYPTPPQGSSKRSKGNSIECRILTGKIVVPVRRSDKDRGPMVQDIYWFKKKAKATSSDPDQVLSVSCFTPAEYKRHQKDIAKGKKRGQSGRTQAKPRKEKGVSGDIKGGATDFENRLGL